MCRWAVYIGSPIYPEDVISLPGHLLGRQSQGTQRCLTPVNADGFGLAWYGERPESGLYRDIIPAWSDSDLNKSDGDAEIVSVPGSCPCLDRPKQLLSFRRR